MASPPKKAPKKKSGRDQAEPDLFKTAEPVEHSTSTARFSGTENLRHLRVIHALMIRPRKREEIDRIAGASNGPALMADLRELGITKKAQSTPGIDRDGKPIKFGVYSLDEADRRAVNAWLRLRNLRGKT
ncbi:hypothetical protein [Janthinobacterium sp. TND4EL3]|uniref:hypothetical protein n=1 Tax=Janthinobacterium sp. TND4EL3 TaxID=1907311 RepID=UPI0009709B9A|nr:hypothetical protein [Janthinobacterium sp. TND4EL3]